MMPEEAESIMKEAVQVWRSIQLIMVMEECSELIKQVSKWIRSQRGTDPKMTHQAYYGIIEEVADVEIMLEQVKIMFQIKEEVEIKKEQKLFKLSVKLKKYRDLRKR